MTQRVQLRVTSEESGLRLDAFLAGRFGALSRMRIASLIAKGSAFVNGNAARPGFSVAHRDEVVVTIDDAPLTSMAPEARPLEIIHEDEDLLVVVKPANILVHPTLGVKSGTLANALVYHLNRDYYDGARTVGDENSAARRPEESTIFPGADGSPTFAMPSHGMQHSLIRPGIVHRLDRATSGLMVVAKSPRALKILSGHFRRRLIEKRYLAVVHGQVTEHSGSIVAPIGRDPSREPKWWVTEGGKSAETRFSVRERRCTTTLLELEPVTGRTNQLRIHCAYVGHPIVGDRIYGGIAEAFGHAEKRLCLHASALAFHHPSGGDWMEFASPLPEEIIRPARGGCQLPSSRPS